MTTVFASGFFIKRTGLENVASLMLIVFVLLVILFFVFVWPRLKVVLANRETKLRQTFEEAEASLKDAQQSLQEAQATLAKVPEMTRDRLDQARGDAAKLKASLAEQAERDAKALEHRIQGEIESARDRARAAIWQHASQRAVAKARLLLVKELDQAAHQRLFNASIQSLPESSSTTTGAA